MIEISFAFTTALLIAGWFLFRLAVYLKTKNFSPRREALQLLFLINLAVISRIVFHPMEVVDGKVQPLLFDAAAMRPFNINLLPLAHIFNFETTREMLLNVIGNFSMFIPTGILTPILYKHLSSFRKTVLTGFLISLTIEILQLPFYTRCSDVNDLILNTLGVMTGYGIYALAARINAGKKESQ